MFKRNCGPFRAIPAPGSRRQRMDSERTLDATGKAPAVRWGEARGGSEAFADLRDVRRDVAEAHAIAIRIHNVVATLAASVKDVIHRQDRYDRGLNLNSFVAYVLFTVLLGGGFF